MICPSSCHWEARPVPGSVDFLRLTGFGLVDLQLPRKDRDTIQECVRIWHLQQAPHGLLMPPPFLLVSLGRYADLAQGKSSIYVPCQAMATVCISSFHQCCSRHQVDAVQTDWGSHPSGAYAPKWPRPCLFSSDGPQPSGNATASSFGLPWSACAGDVRMTMSEPKSVSQHSRKPSARIATSFAFKLYLRRLMHPVTFDSSRSTSHLLGPE